MNYQIFSKNVIVTDSLKEYIADKLSRIDKYGNEALSCRVDISRDAHHKKGEVFRVEINFALPGKLIRSVEAFGDARAAVDAVCESVAQQAHKHTTRKRDKARRTAQRYKETR